ncbi:MAG: DNA mismatch repair protein [Ignavibacteria bacterium GWA2_35_9]|nr:MAG: DNA mismatch repair protein [Ignavibacteria bacterium GWA2_35_9]OGU53504.1 MAG: DNA mismatch repair protein [Ignavibacteria bacterium GWC2_36_12]
MSQKNKFTFEISLSVLNHLGRNLYRSFVTVLGEAISNSWDADAKNVWIYVDKESNSLVIKDDGSGMLESDFQNKFLKIGYSKRKDGRTKSPTGRPFIGRKGIGKLALLSCADKIAVISKTKKSDYVGGVIDNSELDHAITNDLTPDEYPLENWQEKPFDKYIKSHNHGTIIYFENIKGGIKNSLNFLKKIIALYFRFSLLDRSFKIFIDEERITYEHLKVLAEKTEFLWNINKLNDPYIDKQLTNLKEKKELKVKGKIKGFIASVNHYKDLNIMNLDERVSIDLFVNGRLRERDILKHISKSRLVENYLYGQIHFDDLDENTIDRFTSNREGIVADDSKYQDFLKKLEDDVIGTVIADWDKWRRKHRQDGDPENKSITPKERKAEELFNVVSEEYSPPKGSANKNKIDNWVNELTDDAKYNFTSYADCFISENLIRKYIEEKKLPLSPEAKKEAYKWKNEEVRSKGAGNISIDIRKTKADLSYLSMSYLASLVDKKNPDGTSKDINKEAFLLRDANEYKPMRDAVAHTSLLTDIAKKKLSSVYENIKGRIRTLLTSK